MVSMRVVKTLHHIAAAFHRELDRRAFAAANPVALHGAHALRPAFELVQSVQQLLRVCVVRRNHCSSSRCSTSVSSCRQQQPSITCSLASTVSHSGHQFTLLFLR